jgi:hypothetical protein
MDFGCDTRLGIVVALSAFVLSGLGCTSSDGSNSQGMTAPAAGGGAGISAGPIAGTAGASGVSGAAGTSVATAGTRATSTAGTTGGGPAAISGAGAAARAGSNGASGASGMSGNSGQAGTSGSAGGSAGNAAVAGSGGMLAGGIGGGGGANAGAGTGGSSGASGGPAAGSGGGACPGPMPGSQGKNPLFTDQYTADPGALVDGCTFYIHCGHDEGPNSFVLREWFALSSTDMVHWNKQVAMRLSDFSWADANAWAGQVVKKGTKYYWFAPVQERGGGMAIGVAISDSPTGPFRDAIGKPLINDAFEMSNVGFRTPSDTPFTIDPTVWIDDDGKGYLHYGGFSRMMVAKLSDDLLSIDGKMQEVTPRGFFEAAYLFKHNGKYYEVYAAGTNPATIDYSTSASPLGPWQYGGRILDALPALPGQDAATSHSAVAQFAGQWYLVYHLSNGPNGGGTYKREVAVDKLTIKADGTIEKLVPSSGLRF